MGLGTGLGVYLPIVVYIACLIGMLASLFRPAIGLYLTALILPLAYARGRLFDYPFGDHVIELLLLGIIIGLLLTGQPLLPNIPFRRTILLIGFTSYLSLWLGPVFNSAVPWPLTLGESPFGHWILYMRIPLLLLLTYSAIGTRAQVQILLVCMLVSFLWVGKGFRQNIKHRDTSAGFSYDLRHGGGLGFGGSNGMAAYQAQCLMMILGLWGADRRWWLRLAMLGAIAMALYGVLFSYSRGAYVALVAALLYLGLFKLRWILPLLFIAGLSWQVLLPKSVIDRITMTYDESEGDLDASAAERLNVWNHALQISMRNPILGVGFDTFRYYRQGETLRDTHNLYLKTYVDNGIVGVLLLLSFWIRAAWMGHQLSRVAQDPLIQGLGLGTAMMMIVVLLVNLFGDRWTYFELGGMVTMLIGLMLRARTMLIEESQRQFAPIPAAAAPPLAPAPAFKAAPTR